jgi:hypothetical protein
MKSGRYATPTANAAIPTENKAGVPELCFCVGVSESHDCTATITLVHPIILFRVKIWTLN